MTKLLHCKLKQAITVGLLIRCSMLWWKEHEFWRQPDTWLHHSGTLGYLLLFSEPWYSYLIKKNGRTSEVLNVKFQVQCLVQQDAAFEGSFLSLLSLAFLEFLRPELWLRAREHYFLYLVFSRFFLTFLFVKTSAFPFMKCVFGHKSLLAGTIDTRICEAWEWSLGLQCL